jgi:hypothetical protein
MNEILAKKITVKAFLFFGIGDETQTNMDFDQLKSILKEEESKKLEKFYNIALKAIEKNQK